MLKPGGVLYLRDLVYSFEPRETESVVEAWLVNASDNAAIGWTRSELATHLREEYSTFSWLLEPLMEHAGFEIQRIQHSPSRVHSAYACIKRG
jgi:hypothetical protein